MAKRITGLGRGLEALLPTDDISTRLQQIKNNTSITPPFQNPENARPEESPSSAAAGIQELPLAAIKPASEQPRKFFDELTISELAQSIFEHGLLQPILVMPLPSNALLDDGVKYRIIAGERRFRACQVLKWQRISAIVKTVSDIELFELALIENIQREDLTPIDEALAYEHLIRISGLSQQEMAKRLGKGRSALANSLRLLQLPKKVQEGLSQGLIRPGHAKALLMLKNAEALLYAYRLCVDESWSVRKVESYCQGINNPDTASPAKTKREFQEILPTTTPDFVPSPGLVEQYSEKSDLSINAELQSELIQLGDELNVSLAVTAQDSAREPVSSTQSVDENSPNKAETATLERASTQPEHTEVEQPLGKRNHVGTPSVSNRQIEFRADTPTEPLAQPEYWGVCGMLFRQEELENHLTKALQVDLSLKLEGNLSKGQPSQQGRSSAARPQKAFLQVEFASQEQWECWLEKLGLNEALREAKPNTEQRGNALDLKGKALFS